MTDVTADLRTAWRQWTRRPLMPTAVVLTLTAGLGAAIAVFTVAWTVVWRPLDLPAPERLVWIESESAGETDGSSPGAALTWQADARTLEGLAAARPVAGAFADGGGADRLPGALVTASIFRVLGVAPVRGRALTSDDDTPGAARVLLVSHQLWQTRYGGDASAVGRVVTLDGRPATIVGVLPPAVDAVVPAADWWAPLALAPSERANVGPRYLDLIGRLAADASLLAATAELTTIGARLSLKADDGSALGVRVTPLAQHLSARHRAGLVLLLAGVLALVLIACANVATLLLTRAHDRQAELALRASLGASAARLARQLLVEAGLLAALASAAGLVAALWLVDLLRVILPADVPRLADARVDAVSAAFALGAGVVVTLIAGLAPALRGSRVDLQAVLRTAATGGSTSDWLRRGFVVAQVAVAVVLASGGVLMLRSAAALLAAPRGYDAAGVVTASLTLPAATYRDAASIASVIDRIIAGTSAVPGVRAVAAASQLPFAGGSAGSDVTLATGTFADGLDRQTRVRLVSAAYLSTLGVAVIEGRQIDREDTATSRPVVVVNQTLARRLSPTRSPVGLDVKFAVPVFGGDDGRRVWHVVGIAADSWDRGPRKAVEPEVLIPIAQTPPDVFFWISRELQLAVRASGDAAAIVPALRRAVSAVDPTLAVGVARTLDDRIASSFARERLMAHLLGGLGVAGVVLALLGLGAVVHQQVQRRGRDIAIRLAIGASARDVIHGLVSDGARLAIVGAIVGCVASLGTGTLVASLLFGVAPGDPATLAGVAVGVVALAMLAAWLPARRAASIDPADALRN